MGCPYRCVYCNQYATTSDACGTPDRAVKMIRRLAERIISGAERPSELAFYGGTFTALPVKTMTTLLELASDYVEKGIFTGIRFSTRPDALGRQVMNILMDYPISTVELGVQSLDDRVLRASRRGYESPVVYEAAFQVRSSGWKLGIQLMPGLPEDTLDVFGKTVRETCAIKPDFVRIYPTIVLRGTLLEKWYHEGAYRPLSLKEAINWCVQAFTEFESSGIKVIRMGLQATEDLNRGSVVAGPYHPAFGYLVKVHVWRKCVDAAIASIEDRESVTIVVSRKFISECVGPGRINVRYWKRQWNLKNIALKCAELCDCEALLETKSSSVKLPKSGANPAFCVANRREF